MATGKNYACRLEDMTIIAAIENLVTNLCNVRNLAYSDAVREIFLAGYIQLSGQPDLLTLDEATRTDLAIKAELEKVTLHRLREQHLFKLLDDKGEAVFRDWCITQNINPEPIISNSEEIKNRLAADETRGLAIWLDAELSDMLPHKFDDICARAQIDGKLPDALLYPDKYQARLKTLRNIASSSGYTSRSSRGIWQKPMR